MQVNIVQPLELHAVFVICRAVFQVPLEKVCRMRLDLPGVLRMLEQYKGIDAIIVPGSVKVAVKGSKRTKPECGILWDVFDHGSDVVDLAAVELDRLSLCCRRGAEYLCGETSGQDDGFWLAKSRRGVT